MALYYVTSADVGAPQSQGVNNQGCLVFDFILNTTAGLTIAYTGTNKRVYAMPNGSYLRIVHDSAVSGSAALMTVRASEGASGIDTLIDPYPTVALKADNVSTWQMSANASATNRSWWALVDTTLGLFVFNCDVSSNGAAGGGNIWFNGGTSGSLLAVDNYCSFISIRNSASVAIKVFQPFGRPGTANGEIWWMRTRDGTIKSPTGFLSPYYGTASWDISSGPAYPDPDDLKYRMDRVIAGDSYSTLTAAGIAPEVKRAYVPRVWQAAHGPSAFASIAIGDQFTNGAYNTQIGGTALFAHFPFGNSAGSSGAEAIQISGAWTAPTEL